MFTIMMDKNKQLIITKRATLYWNENIVDDLLFLLPTTYNDLSLAPFTFSLEWIDPSNVAHVEVLTLLTDEATGVPLYFNYNEQSANMYLQYQLPVTSTLSKYAGKVTIKLTGTWVDENGDYTTKTVVDPDTGENVERRIYPTYTLRTGEVEIEISQLSDYFASVSSESLTGIDSKIAELNKVANGLAKTQETINSNLADDLKLTKDGFVYLTADGKELGNGIEIGVIAEEMDDDAEDGIVDIESSTGSGIPASSAVDIIDL